MTRLLALIPGGIGDQFLCFPMLESLQQHYPQAQIDVVVEPSAKPAYRVSRVVRQVLTYSFAGRTGPADWSNLVGSVREREYDALVTLDKKRFGGVLLWLMAVPTRVGYAGQPNSSFLTRTVVSKPQQYAAARYHDLLKPLGVQDDCPALAINVPRKDIEWAEGELKRLELTAEQGYVLLHGGKLSEHEMKGNSSVYSVSGWQSLIRGFQDRQPELPIMLMQFPSDREWFRPIAEGCAGLKVALPEDYGKMAALIAGAKLMVCTDSDAMHLAVALGTYLFVLFGSASPELLLPQDERFTAMRSQTGRVTDIPPIQVLEKIWGK
jgi:ADP-heptose:LPS heptosyltransferase